MEDEAPGQSSLESGSVLHENLRLSDSSSSDDEDIELSEKEEEETPSPPRDMEDQQPSHSLAETILKVLSDLSVIQDINMKGNKVCRAQECLEKTHNTLQEIIHDNLKWLNFILYWWHVTQTVRLSKEFV